jgi:O-antigen/teichoic acid export membrane protein
MVPQSFGDGSALTPAEVRRRASAGLLVLGTRGLAILLIGLASNVVLARLLSPRDFGLVAVGLTFVTFVGLLADGGLGAGLIRRAKPPELSELRALLGLQLIVTAVTGACVAAVAMSFGKSGLIVTVMVASTLLVALQFPGKILLERDLSYRPLAFVEVTQVLAYNLTAIGLVLAGAGVWGLALGTVVRAGVGAAGTIMVSPVRVFWPLFSWSRIRPLVAFGLRLQLVSATWLVREQGLNAAVAAVGGVATLGLSSLARRLLQIPSLLLQSLWRVSFPAMSQLVAAKEAPGRLIERAVAVAAVGTGTVLVGLAGSAPGLVPGVFGEQWRAAADVMPGACLGLVVAGSISVATQGYLYAVGDATAVLRAAVLSAVAVFVVTLPLLPSLRTWAIGIGMLASSLTEAGVLARSTRAHVSVRMARIVLAPALVGTGSGALGWYVASSSGADLLSGLAGGAVAIGSFLMGMFILRREQLSLTCQVALRAVGNARRRPARAQN